MLKLFKNGKEEQQARKVEFDNFIEECKEHNKAMRDECVNIMGRNAYVCGKAGIEIDFEKDVYSGYTEEELEVVKKKYHDGMFDILSEKSKKYFDEKYSEPLADEEIEKLFEFHERAKRDSRYHNYKGEFDDYKILFNATQVVCDRVNKKWSDRKC